ncbi:MAG: hypothetical protein KDA53_03035 [Hyphomonas sp.]|nr:hypothetical protein [Hyphomonas sp.]
MTDHTALFTHGVRLISEALLDIVASANLQVNPSSISRTLYRRCRGRFRQLAVILRRMIWLMALGLPSPPPESSRSRLSAPPEGAEDVTASFGPRLRRFCFAPSDVAPPPEDLARRTGGPPAPSVRGLIETWAALHRVLTDPEAHARRLARSIARQRRAGRPRPFVFAQAGRHRLRPELGVIAALLPELLNAEFAGWYDPG